MFHLKPLPYDLQALEPALIKEQVAIHYQKHHQTYVDNLNKIIQQETTLQKKSLVELLSDAQALPESSRQAIINFGGGVYNHDLFWQCMHHADTATTPTGPLLEAIIRDFGSFEACKQQLTQVATTWFGSGWGWLCIDKNNKLIITGTANQNCPLSDKLYPLLTIDVWEHAYYIQYQNLRADFVQSWWSLVNWQFVQERYHAPFAR